MRKSVVITLPIVWCLYLALVLLPEDWKRGSFWGERAATTNWLIAQATPTAITYWTGLLGLALLVGSWLYIAWSIERATIRRALLRSLGLPEGPVSFAAARERIMALVPFKSRVLRGKLARLAPEHGVPLWLCFLPGRLLVASGLTGETAELTMNDLRNLYLVEDPTSALAVWKHHVNRVTGNPDSNRVALEALFTQLIRTSLRRYSLGIESPDGISKLDFDYVDDLVRIVNLLVRQGVRLRFLREGN